MKFINQENIRIKKKPEIDATTIFTVSPSFLFNKIKIKNRERERTKKKSPRPRRRVSKPSHGRILELLLLLHLPLLQSVPAKRTRSSPARDPGVQTPPVEEVLAPQLPHLLPLLDVRQAKHAHHRRIRLVSSYLRIISATDIPRMQISVAGNLGRTVAVAEEQRARLPARVLPDERRNEPEKQHVGEEE